MKARRAIARLSGLQGFGPAFQADDEGSIPFTRSNLLKHRRHLTDLVRTSGLSRIATKRCSPHLAAAAPRRNSSAPRRSRKGAERGIMTTCAG